MTLDKLRPGATVRLRSGGPSMVVERVVGRHLHCVVTEGGKPRTVVYTAACVDVVVPGRLG